MFLPFFFAVYFPPASAETLWSIVKKNRRVRTAEEKQKKPKTSFSHKNGDRGVSTDAVKPPPYTEEAEFPCKDNESLLAIFSLPSTSPAEKFSETTSFFDRPSDASGPKVCLDKEGNLIIKDRNCLNTEDASSSNDFRALIEGRHRINENMAKSQIPAYEGAYKRSKNRKWTTEETTKFYQMIEMFGTDLMMVQVAMPEFTDKQIRDKFKVEEKRNYQKMEAALKTHREIKLPAYEAKAAAQSRLHHSTQRNDSAKEAEAEKSPPLGIEEAWPPSVNKTIINASPSFVESSSTLSTPFSHEMPLLELFEPAESIVNDVPFSASSSSFSSSLFSMNAWQEAHETHFKQNLSKDILKLFTS